MFFKGLVCVLMIMSLLIKLLIFAVGIYIVPSVVCSFSCVKFSFLVVCFV